MNSQIKATRLEGVLSAACDDKRARLRRGVTTAIGISTISRFEKDGLGRFLD
jgi:hypothetical protein